MNSCNEPLVIPLTITPKKPHAPCTENASNGSSINSYLHYLDDMKYNMPLTIPTTLDTYVLDTSHDAVMPTSPANIPLPRQVTLCSWSTKMDNNRVVRPPNDAAMVVWMVVSCTILLISFLSLKFYY